MGGWDVNLPAHRDYNLYQYNVFNDLTAHFLFARDQNTKTGSIDGKLFIHEGSVVHNVQMKGKEKGTTRGRPLHSLASQIATFLIRTTCFLGKRRK